MNSPENTSRSNQWLEYYKKFDYFSPDNVREDCYPGIMERETPVDRAIVLVHGLTDSPYFLAAIADHFHNNLGYNVYLPLLHSHGLKEPKGMEGVDLKEWKANVRFAINTAATKADRISIGGLSTGGTLAFYMASTNNRINGEIYLFSAALDLAGGPLGIIGEVKERLLRTFMADVLDKFDENKPLIGRNPYRYARMDMDGAQELARLIKETDELLDTFDAKDPFPKRVFAAHSICDKTADIKGIRTLQKKTPQDRFVLYEISKEFNVSHASLVLREPIRAMNASKDESPLENANPKFQDMMAAVTKFQMS